MPRSAMRCGALFPVGEDKLIETLAHEMAEFVVRRFELARVELELRKYILPETRYVAARVVREL